MQLEIEREALRKETDKASIDRLAKLEKELADLKEEQRTLTAHWTHEKEAIQQSANLKEELDGLRRDVEAAQRHGDYAKASELQYGRIPQLEAQIRAQEAPVAGGTRLLKEQVDEEDIAEVVGKWTGIPVSRLMEGEVQKLIQMEARLHQRVVGQARRGFDGQGERLVHAPQHPQQSGQIRGGQGVVRRQVAGLPHGLQRQGIALLLHGDRAQTEPGLRVSGVGPRRRRECACGGVPLPAAGSLGARLHQRRWLFGHRQSGIGRSSIGHRAWTVGLSPWLRASWQEPATCGVEPAR
jgi:hypothetical protein